MRMLLRLRLILAQCALGQGRLDDVRLECDAGVAAAERVNEPIWSRRLRTLRAMGAMQSGDLDGAARECGQLLMDHMVAQAKDADYVQVLVLHSMLLRERVLGVDAIEAGAKLLE